MRNEYKLFIGIGADGEAVYVEVTFGSTKHDGVEVYLGGYYAMSATTAYMEVYTDKSLAERMADQVDEYDNEYIGELLRRFTDTTYEELPALILNMDGRDAVMDVDTFFPEFTLDDEEESQVVWCVSAGGQHDIRHDFLDESGNLLDDSVVALAVPINFFKEMAELWDELHLVHYPAEPSSYGAKMTAEQYERVEAFKEKFFTILEQQEQLNTMHDYLMEYVKNELHESIKY